MSPNWSLVRSIVSAAVVVTSVVVGIVAGWQLGLAAPILAALVYAIVYSVGLGHGTLKSGYEAFYGDNQEEADHWSRPGANPGGPF